MSQPILLIPFHYALQPQEPQGGSDTPTSGDAPTGGTILQPTPDDQGKTVQGQDPCGQNVMLMLPVFLFLMYFMMIRPEQKRKKQQDALQSSIKVNDQIVTLSGLHGTVSSMDTDTVTLRIDTVNMTFDRSAVSRIVRDTPES
jgi:preprotein translocase subunit YajC